MFLRGGPAPVYKGGRGEEAGLGVRQVGGGDPTWTPSPIRPLPSLGGGKGEGEGEGEGKRVRAPSPSQIWTPHGGHPLAGCLASLLRPMWPITSPGGFR